MINSDYCQLPVAAERFKCTTDDLLRLGATGQLSIYFFPAGLQLVSEKYADDEIIERRIVDAYEPLKLSRRSIELLEAGKNDALVDLDFDSDTTHKVRRFAPTIKRDHYDFTEMFANPAAWNKKTETDYHDVKISDVKLVVKRSELMHLVKSPIESEVNSEQSEKEHEPWLIADPKDPPDPAQPWYTPARYFARKLVEDDSNLLTNKPKLERKVVLALNNAGVKTARKGKFSINGTILKAWVNVSLG
jgi:hypothetical protein